MFSVGARSRHKRTWDHTLLGAIQNSANNITIILVMSVITHASQSIPPTQNYGDTFSGSRTPPFYDTFKAYLSGVFAVSSDVHGAHAMTRRQRQPC